jgi:hypothetical protein
MGVSNVGKATQNEAPLVLLKELTAEKPYENEQF